MPSVPVGSDAVKRDDLQRRMASAYGSTEVRTEPEQLSATEAYQRLAELAKGNRKTRRALEKAWAQEQAKRGRKS